MIANGIDWLGDFKTLESQFVLTLLEGPSAPLFDILNNDSIVSKFPEPLKSYCIQLKIFLSQYLGVGNNLVEEAIQELDLKGPIEDGIAFVHSGATAPLLTALKVKPYDINTVLIYEGPHPNYYDNISNPNLHRVIHVLGSNHGPANSVLEGDSMVPFLNYAHFSNTAYADFDVINVEIKGAFHNDYSYNPSDYADHTFWDEKKAERQRINRRTNLFMRDLYQAALTEETQAGDLKRFFDLLTSTGAAVYQNGIWKIDPNKLRDTTAA